MEADLIMAQIILLISCPDSRGITAAVTDFIFKHNGNILHADQHIDEQSNTFFMRIEWEREGFNLSPENIKATFGRIAEQFKMSWQIYFSDQKTRVAIFVSKPLHCLHDLLFRWKTGQINCDLGCIVSNHLDAQPLAEELDIPFVHFPIFKENKHEQERRQIELLLREKIDCVVLARYHQILTTQFIEAFHNKIINIHHSFLPAFVGSNPYLQAQQRGVKIIGATSHYVIEALDQGPIIEQDTVRISHRDSLEDLIREGQDLEKIVLSRAVRWHLERKILCYGNKTVVFD